MLKQKVWLQLNAGHLLLCGCNGNSRRVRAYRLPAMASTTGNEAVELSSFASGTGKSSAERLKVIQVRLPAQQWSDLRAVLPSSAALRSCHVQPCEFNVVL